MADIPASPKRLTVDRLLSKLGIASRGTSQEWISAGRIRINGRVIRDPATWVVWPKDSVSIDDKPIQESVKRFVLFHKPKGVITTHSDEQGRKTIFDVLPTDLRYLHAVGRLDQATSGLLLLTNDSVLSSFLTDPANEVMRTYLVSVRGAFTETEATEAVVGVVDAGERLRCHRVKIQKSSGRESHLEVVLIQGKNREIRRLFKALGHEVTRLRRIQYGPFKLDDLPSGAWKEISVEDVRKSLQLPYATGWPKSATEDVSEAKKWGR
ncbi:MAG: rRNA pseudouridine synthase [Nitrospira sp.]|nr:rRNA pseudouridine synthase [Nitrospira sp.]